MSKKDECFAIFDAHSEAKRERAIELAMSQATVTRTTANTYYPAWRKEFMSKLSYAAPEKFKKEKQERVKKFTKGTDIITKIANKITEVDKKSTSHAFDIQESKPTLDETKHAIKNIKIEDTVNKPIIPDIDIEKIVSNAFAEVKEKFNGNNEKIFAEAKALAAIRNEKLISEVKEIINPKVEGINWKVDVINPVETEKEKEDILVVSRLVPVVMIGKHGTYNFETDGVKVVSCEEFLTKGKMDEALEALAIWARCYGKEGVNHVGKSN